MSLRVLVADDSSTMRKIIIRALMSIGAPGATEAADGGEAMALFQPGKFDLVLTDWNMPVKTGLEVLQEIRSLDRKVPVIMISNDASKPRVLQAIQAGVTDFLVKPFTAESLKEKLEKRGF